MQHEHIKLLMHENQDERIIIQRELVPLQDLEWWEPETMTQDQINRLAFLRKALETLKHEYAQLCKERTI